MNIQMASPASQVTPAPRRCTLLCTLFKLGAAAVVVAVIGAGAFAAGSVAGVAGFREASLDAQGNPSRIAEQFAKAMDAGDARAAARHCSPEVAMDLKRALRAHKADFHIDPGGMRCCSSRSDWNIGTRGTGVLETRSIVFDVPQKEGKPKKLEVRTESTFQTRITAVFLDGAQILPVPVETEEAK
jgi:hypothetical protein